jgi:hypothetical protein
MDPQPAVTSTARLTAQEPATAQASLTTHTQDLDRDITARKSYRTEREMVRTFLKNQRRNSPAPQEPVPANQPMRSRNCRIVGNYELEDIYLEKNGTSQLGITLGYDSSAAHGGCLYVCEVSCVCVCVLVLPHFGWHGVFAIATDTHVTHGSRVCGVEVK